MVFALIFLSCGSRDVTAGIKAQHGLFRKRHSGKMGSLDERQAQHVTRNSAPRSPNTADAKLYGDKAYALCFNEAI